MKNTAIILSVFSLLSVYSCQKTFLFSEKELNIQRGLARYFNGEVTLGKKVFYSLSGEREMDIEITLKCDDLKKYYDAPEEPASFCVWQFFTQLTESERDAINTYTVEIPFDNKLRVVKYDLAVLQRVLSAKYMLDSVSGYFIRGDYGEMKSYCRADLKKEKSLPKFFEFAKKADAERGKTKSAEIRGFQYYEVQEDSASASSSYSVEFHVLQQRDSTHNKLSVMVDPLSQDGFITRLSIR